MLGCFDARSLPCIWEAINTSCGCIAERSYSLSPIFLPTLYAVKLAKSENAPATAPARQPPGMSTDQYRLRRSFDSSRAFLAAPNLLLAGRFHRIDRPSSASRSKIANGMSMRTDLGSSMLDFSSHGQKCAMYGATVRSCMLNHKPQRLMRTSIRSF